MNNRAIHTLWRYSYLIFAIIMVLKVVRYSVIEEDAFITFRVVEHFLQGYGLRWNIEERVQAFTNPLWMFLHIPVYYLTDNIIIADLLISWACLVICLWLVPKTFPEVPRIRLAVLFVLSLLVCPTFELFFTSGLENPLLHALFIMLGYVILARPQPQWFAFSLLVALSAFARLDTLVFYAPLSLAYLYLYRREVKFAPIFLGALPLIGWLAFSLFYYGSLMPNTSYAKLGTGLPAAAYLYNGIVHLIDSMLRDMWMAVMLISSSIYFPYLLFKSRSRDALIAGSIALGIILYTVYVVRIGGYQLAFRMFSLQLIAAIWLWTWKFPVQHKNWHYLLLVPVMLLYAQANIDRVTAKKLSPRHFSSKPYGHRLFAGEGRKLKLARYSHMKANRHPAPRKVVVYARIGMKGFTSPASRMYVDPLALADPLLARLPSINNAPDLQHFQKVNRYRTGHNMRHLPRGYLHAVETGDLSKMSPDIALYYSKIRLITRGELWDTERLKAIWELNTGRYDSFLESYVDREYYNRGKVIEMDQNGSGW